MRIQPKNREEAMKLVFDILNQGDSRYNAPENEEVLSSFLINQAISLEESAFPELNEPDKKDVLIHNVQGWEKQIAKALLKIRGFEDAQILFERRFFGSVPDVVAEKDDLTIIVECCSCRIDKIIDYLSKVDEIWVLTRGEKPWEAKPLFEKMQWFIFKKGANWDNIYGNFQKKRIEELKKVKSPLDRL